MSGHPPSRNIYPFGDKRATLDIQEYLLDCTAFASRSALEEAIREGWKSKGLVVLANTNMQHLRELKSWGSVVFQDFADYAGGSAPRSRWGEDVFSIDDTPQHVDITYHNEMCYLAEFPQGFVIGSLAAPRQGGETWVSDNAVTTDIIQATPLGQALREKGVRYIRNMTDRHAANAIVHKHWQDTFFTESRAEAEAYIQSKGWDYEWLADGSLRISYVVDAFEYHAQLGRALYFAGLCSHGVFFDSWHPYNTLPDIERPYTMTLGDGEPFSDEDIAQLYAAYNQAALPVNWHQADIVMLDNLRWSHARPAYQLQPGDERIMGIAMGMMKQRVGCQG